MRPYYELFWNSGKNSRIISRIAPTIGKLHFYFGILEILVYESWGLGSGSGLGGAILQIILEFWKKISRIISRIAPTFGKLNFYSGILEIWVYES